MNITIKTLGQKLADPDAIQQLFETSGNTLFCSDCGEVITREGARCTLAHCQYEGQEDLVSIQFATSDDVLFATTWISPTTDMETLINGAAEDLEAKGYDADELTFLGVFLHIKSRGGTYEVLENMEQLA